MKIYILKIIRWMFIIFFISIIVIEGLIIVEGNRLPKEEVDYLIVLGARLYGETPSPSLLERLKVANEYLKKNEDVKVVVSGGQGPDEYVSEGYAMSKYLLDNGISKDRIIIEDRSTNTFENLKFSLDKIRENESKENIKVLIVTNKYHVFRSKMLGERLGMESYGLPGKVPPTVFLKSYIREYFAVIKSFLYDRL